MYSSRSELLSTHACTISMWYYCCGCRPQVVVVWGVRVGVGGAIELGKFSL